MWGRRRVARLDGQDEVVGFNIWDSCWCLVSEWDLME